MIRWILILLCFSGVAQHNIQLNSLAENIYQNTNVPGLTLAVIKNDSVVYQKNLGVKSLKTNQKVNENSKFFLASISKVFTGTAIMKLAQEGKIDLNKPVVNYCPDFKPNYGKYSSDSIRVIHLISHTSGLEKFINKKDHFDEEINSSSEERIALHIKKTKLRFKPGVQYEYSNLGFMVAEVVIEKVTGQKFSDYMATEILQPLKMNNSTFSQVNNLLDTSLATPHAQKRKGPVPINKNLYTNGVLGSGGLKSSNNDFSKWLIELMKIYHNQSGFITKQTLDKMWTAYTPENGLCFDAWKDKKGHTNISKGGNFGYKSDSYFLMVPDKKFGVFIFTNSWSYNFDQEVIPFIKECKKLYL
ncbi:MAG: serine hydrolase [Flavobacteriales bacterium]|nr:serine hydrolase [Flavobacteriales bacterium]